MIFNRTQNIEVDIKKLEKWLNKQRYILVRLNTTADEVDDIKRIVYISRRSKPINQLFSLLHECRSFGFEK